jgi:hypothetical protein
MNILWTFIVRLDRSEILFLYHLVVFVGCCCAFVEVVFYCFYVQVLVECALQALFPDLLSYLIFLQHLPNITNILFIVTNWSNLS